MAEGGELDPKRRRVDVEIKRSESLLHRKWSERSLEAGRGRELTVMSFNLQADGMHRAQEQFNDIPDEHLDYPARFQFALEEIKRVNPDVLCLQEVNHYYREDERSRAFNWEEELKNLGYEGHFIAKCNVDPSFYHGMPIDGCSLHVRTASRLKLREPPLKVKVGERLGEHPEEVEGSDKPFGYHDKNTNVLIAAEVLDAETDRSLFVASTTHAPSGPHVFNQQCRQAHAKCWAKLLKEKFPGKRLVLCGDMNEEPGEVCLRTNLTSGVHHLKTALGLCGVYETVLGKPLEFTSIHPKGGRMCIDFILTSDGLKPVQVFEIPTGLPAEINHTQCLISEHYPSDHLAIAAKISVLDEGVGDC